MALVFGRRLRGGGATNVSATVLFVGCALTAAGAIMVSGCGRTPDLQPPPPVGSLPAMGLLPAFTQSVNNDIDIVFMIDNSGSMMEEQENLRRNFPAFTSVLKNLPQGLPNVHIAVVSSDLGTGQFTDVPRCLSPGGMGRFQNLPRVPGCTGPRDSYISAVGGVHNYDGDIDQVFACIAQLGTSGCGFEHQLEAVRVAIDPDLMPPENKGFLRDEAILAVVLVTDEDDCSAPDDTTLFDPRQTQVTDPLGPLTSYRCNEFGHLCNGQRPPRTAATNLQDCHSAEDGRLIRISELVAFFKTLKADVNDVMIAAVTGPPTPYSVTTVRAQGARSAEPQIVPSCRSANGSADPAVRINDFVSAFGDNGTFLSICADDFSPVMARIGAEVARRASLECLTAAPADADPATPGLQPHCEVYEELHKDGATLRSLIPSCSDGPTPCWRVEASSKCLTSGWQMVVDRGGAVPAAGTKLNVVCETCSAAEDPGCP